MTVLTLDPDTQAKGDRETLRKQVEAFVEQLVESLEDVSTRGRGEVAQDVREAAGALLSSERGDLSPAARFRKMCAGESERPGLSLHVEGQKEIRLPKRITALLFEILAEVAQGHSVSIGTQDEELTTGEAADLLNVSRPHLVKLLEAGEIPFHKVGTHRRVNRADVLDYKARQRDRAEAAMRELADQAQELDLGY